MIKITPIVSELSSGWFCKPSTLQPYLVIAKSKRMGILFFLIGVSLLVALGFLISCLWAIRSGQYDDEYTPSVRILLDDIKQNEEQNQ